MSQPITDNPLHLIDGAGETSRTSDNEIERLNEQARVLSCNMASASTPVGNGEQPPAQRPISATYQRRAPTGLGGREVAGVVSKTLTK